MAKKPSKSDTPQTQELQRELQATAQDLKAAYEKFNYVSEAELVEACVYEISALKSRYNYLLRRYKELTGQPAAAQPAPAEEPYVAASAMKGGNTCRS